MDASRSVLVLGGVPATDLLLEFGSPLYVYEEDVIADRIRRLRDALPSPGVDVLYACKANSNPEILRIFLREGIQIDAVSEGEVRAALRAGFPGAMISFNGNNVTEAEMRAVRGLGVPVTVDSLSQLERYAAAFPGTACAVRINPDVGAGHHEHVITGGPESKFGIGAEDAEGALALAGRARVTIEGLHQHIGSGILEVDELIYAIDVLLGLAARFPDLRFVDFGGGLGVPYRPEDAPFDLPAFGQKAEKRLTGFRRRYGSDVLFRFEPGRFLVAESGTLLCTVTAVKREKRHTFAGTDTGFNHLQRPMVYGAYHGILNASRLDGRPERYAVAGNICESGDLFAKDRKIASIEEGDCLAILCAGAYGYSMASTYNLRPRPAEVIVKDGQARLARARETFDDLLRGF